MSLHNKFENTKMSQIAGSICFYDHQLNGSLQHVVCLKLELRRRREKKPTVEDILPTPPNAKTKHYHQSCVQIHGNIYIILVSCIQKQPALFSQMCAQNFHLYDDEQSTFAALLPEFVVKVYYGNLFYTFMRKDLLTFLEKEAEKSAVSRFKLYMILLSSSSQSYF